MKKITLTTICALFAFAVLAQAPQGISHQAVIRNAANELVVNTPIGIQVSILQGSDDGTVVYSETHTATSNANGLISFVIGQGTILSGVFANIDWANGPYFIKTQADPTGGTNYTIEGTSQMLSMPYALHAGSTSDKHWEQNGYNIYSLNSGNVGIGIEQPTGKLHVSVPGEWLGVVFTGAGLNDLEVNISGYNGTGATAYAVRIQNTGPIPNHIETSTDGGYTWSTPIGIVPDINMGNGVIINFGSTAGYTYGNRWDWTVNENFGDVLVVTDDKLGIGTANPEAQLHTTGSIRFEGAGTPGEGKVLTSDANGVASWQNVTNTLSCIDDDGNAYPTIVIGDQIWMAENLRVTKYRNGDPIPNVTGDAAWGALTSGAYSWYANNQMANAKYGALYNWHAVNDPRSLCPVGWKVPTDDEWTAFTNMLGGSDVAGGKLKAVSPLWVNPNTEATNSSGFSALPGGLRLTNGLFVTLGSYGIWWSSTMLSSTSAWSRTLSYTSGSVFSSSDDKKLGFSVRCLRD